jgi:hypothetical protein
VKRLRLTKADPGQDELADLSESLAKFQASASLAFKDFQAAETRANFLRFMANQNECRKLERKIAGLGRRK